MRVPCTILGLALVSAPLMASSADIDELLQSASQGGVIKIEDLTDTLLASGADGTRRWYQALDLRRQGRDLLFPEDAPPELDPRVLATLELLTTRVPAEVLARIPDLEPGPRLVAAHVSLDVLQRNGAAEDLQLAIALAVPHPEATYGEYRPVGRDLADAVSAILSRDDRGYAKVERAYGGGHEWIDLPLLRGLGATRAVRSLQLLPRLLASVPKLDAIVLIEIGNVARAVETPLGDAALTRVRMYLTSNQSEQRKQAAVALGRLDDYDSIDPLIELLLDEERGVRTNAYWALREITAMTINAEPNRWRMWFSDETGWWAEQAPELLAYLNDSDTAEVCRALNECGRKRLFRRQLTPELIPLLRHEDTTVVRATCSALFALRATEAAADMIEVLDHPDFGVRDHAWAMLRGLTGRDDLPPEPRAWREALLGGQPSAR
jgi:HEAT repeat protein